MPASDRSIDLDLESPFLTGREHDFERGAHVPLFAELQQAAGLRSRLEVRQDVEDRFDIRLDG
jgi:hypothetical protein